MSAQKYRKKPVVIEAIQFTDTKEGVADVLRFVPRPLVGLRETATGRLLSIRTLEGDMTAQPGDWIIRGVKGEFYPCKPDIFDATYESVIDDETQQMVREDRQA